jgi:dTMP kinase
MLLNKFKGKLIVFEGEDHCGKTTVAKLLNQALNDAGIKSIFTFQPGDPSYGPHALLIDKFCTKKEYPLDPLSNLFAFLLDRSEHTAKVVIPALKNGTAVVSDRWWYSTIAYQFYGKQLLEKYYLDKKFAGWMNILASHYIQPDISFYFQRQQQLIDNDKDDESDQFESADDSFKRRVKNAYLDMVNDKIFVKIDVSSDPNETLQRVLNADFYVDQ